MPLVRNMSVVGLVLALGMEVGCADIAVDARGESGQKKESSTDSNNAAERTLRAQFVADSTADSDHDGNKTELWEPKIWNEINKQ